MKDLIKDESSKGLGVLSILDRAALFHTKSGPIQGIYYARVFIIQKRPANLASETRGIGV